MTAEESKYSKFLEELPDPDSTFRSKSIEILRPTLASSKLLNNDEHIIDELQLSETFNKFMKSHSFDKFNAFINWVESKKNLKPQTIYQNAENFKFISNGDGEIKVKTEFEVNFLSISPNRHFLAVGNETLGVHLWDFDSMKKILEFQDEDNPKDTCMVLGNQYLYTGGWDKNVKQWNNSTGRIIRHYGGHMAPILSIAMGYNEDVLASGAEENHLMTWDLNTKILTPVINAHSSPIGALIVTKDSKRIISGSWDKTIKIWKYPELTEEFQLEGHKDMIRVLGLSFEQKFLASGGDDKIVKIWDLESKKEIHSFYGHRSCVTGVQFSKDGGLLASSSNDRTIKIWNLKKNEIKKTIEAHKESITSMILSADGKKLISGALDKMIRIANFEKDYERHLFEGNKAEVLALAIYSNNKLAVTGGKDLILRIWEINQAILKHELSGHLDPITAISVDKEGEKMVSGDESGKIMIWDGQTFALKSTLSFHKKAIMYLRCIETSSVLSCGADNIINFFNCKNFSVYNSFNKISNPVTAFELFPNGSLLFLALAGNPEIRSIETQAFDKIITYKGHKAQVSSMRLSENVQFLISGSIDGILIFWDVSTQEILQIINTELEIFCVEMMNDSSTMISSHIDKTIRLWNRENGQQTGITDPHPFIVKIMALTPDGSTLISTGEMNHKLRRIILNKIKTKYVINYHKNKVNVVILSRDQRILAVGSNDKTISLWDTRTMKFIGSLEGHNKNVQCLAMTIDSKKLFSGAEDNTLRCWDLELMKEIKISKHFVGNVTSVNLYNIESIDNSDSGLRILSSSTDKSIGIFDENLRLIKSQRLNIGQINCSIPTYNNRICYSGGQEDDIRVHNLLEDSLESLHNFEAHKGGILSITISENDEKLYSSGFDSKIKIWSILDNEKTILIYSMSSVHNINKLVLNWKGNTLFTVSEKKISMWNLENYKKIAEYENSEKAKISSICLTMDETTLYSGSSDKKVRAWNLIDCKEFPFIEGHTSPINALAMTSDGKYLASGDSKGLLIIIDLIKGKEKYTIEINQKIMDLLFTHDNTKIITIHSSNIESIRIWATETGQMIDRFAMKELVPKSMLLSSNDKLLILGFNDSSIALWDFEKKKVEKSLLGHCGGVHSLIMLRDENTLISAGSDTFIMFWDLRKAHHFHTFKGHEETIRSLVVNSDESLLFSGGDERKVFIWDMKSHSLLKVMFEGHEKKIKKLVMSPMNDKLFVACSEKIGESNQKFKSLYVWKLATYELTKDLDEHFKGFSTMVLFKDTKSLITAGNDKTIRIFDYERSFKMKSSFSGHSSEITTIGIAKARHIIAIGDIDSIISVWDLKTNTLLTRLEGHQDQINALIITTKGMVISGSSDRKIGFWSIKDRKLISFLQGHNAEVLSMAITEDETRLLTAGNDVTVRLWDLNDRIQVKKFQSGLDRIMGLCFFPDQKSFLAGGTQRHLKLWHLDDEDSESETLAILNAGIISITISPNGMLYVILLNSKKLQVWDAKNYTLMSEFDECPNLINAPVFLTKHFNRLILFFDKLIDCFTGEVVFRFQPPYTILAYFYDVENQLFFFLSENYKFFKFDNDYFINYLLNYINNDSLLTLSKNADVICNRNLSSFPYIFSFLHLISIYEKNEFFSLEKLQEIYSPYTSNFFSKFYNVDIFSNTPLDILIQKKNMNLIVKYFNMILEYLRSTPCDFYQKIRFFIYNFRNEYTIANLLCDLIPMMGHDLSIISELFDLAFLPFDNAIYDNSLLSSELEEPILIETESIYVDKSLIELKIQEFFKTKQEETNEKAEPQENCSTVKAKLICLPGLCNIKLQKTFDFISMIADLNTNNPVFKNKPLVLLVNFIWEKQTVFLFKIEMFVFIFYFFLFNLNFAFLRDIRDQENNADIPLFATCGVIDVILFLYALFCMANEFRQFFGSDNYFKSVWNYFDLTLIPLVLLSSGFDFILMFWNFTDNLQYIELTYSICAFCFWFRFLSFFRAFKETSSMIGLILSVISGVKYFMFFMILFIFTLTTTFYILQSEATGDFDDYWTTFLYFYHSATGDTSGITSTDLVFTDLNQYFGIISTFLFYIISLNLLVSIIGDKRSECKAIDDEIRIYELANIIVDTHCSLLTHMVNWFRKERKTGIYLIQLYNERHELKEEDKLGNLEGQIIELKNYVEETIEKKFGSFKKENEKLLEKYMKEMKELIKANNKD